MSGLILFGLDSFPKMVSQTSCPILYVQIRELNHFAAYTMSEMDKNSAANNQRATRGRQAGSDSDFVGKLMDMFGGVSNCSRYDSDGNGSSGRL